MGFFTSKLQTCFLVLHLHQFPIWLKAHFLLVFFIGIAIKTLYAKLDDAHTVYHTFSRVSKLRLIVWWGLASRLKNVWWGFRFATKWVMGFRSECGKRWNQRESRKCHFIWGWYVGTKVYTRFRCTIFVIFIGYFVL